MKMIVAYILILLVTTQTFSKWLTIAAFNLNRDYIAKNLCENRRRPALGCGGQCVLMKRMKQEEQQEKNSPAPVKIDFSNVVLSSRSFFLSTDDHSSSAADLLAVKCPVSIGKPVDRTTSIFHPPGA
jgi:hypothetical protein